MHNTLKNILEYWEKNANKFRWEIDAYYRVAEHKIIEFLLAKLASFSQSEQQVEHDARQFIENVRSQEKEKNGIEALMMHYDLSSDEGIMLMCLAEALLRVPDKENEDLLIQDKLTSAHWEKHLGVSESTFVNLTTRGLHWTSKLLKEQKNPGFLKKIWYDLIKRAGEPVIRQAVREAIKMMSHQFVLGRTIDEALKNSEHLIKQGYSFSYDMLGEVARTEADAERYFQAYKTAIEAIGKNNQSESLFHGPSISIKLSALYPRYEFNKYELAVKNLTTQLKKLALCAKAHNISLTVDAEEADRLDMSLDIFRNVFCDPEFNEWQGIGLAVQAYQKRAYFVIEWLIDLASRLHKRIPVRLVKGAYWDTEIKLSQIGGFVDYPVFTRKINTDVSYLACAQRMLQAQNAIYPQFATHNAYSVAAILNMLQGKQEYDFEFQNLQGMGKSLHNQLIAKQIHSRIYAPVGSHEDLLPYLVRRLLENGANSSFVNKIADASTPIENLIGNPIKKITSFQQVENPKIPLPRNIYGKERINSKGIDFSHFAELKKLSADIEPVMEVVWNAGGGESKEQDTSFKPVTNPADRRQIVGKYREASFEEINYALKTAKENYIDWDARGVNFRAELLLKVADLLEKHTAELMALAVREAGKTFPNAQNEVREAVDFCRYYAELARKELAPKTLVGPTGEKNELYMHGKGVFVCISPWNFPIAIFTGQIAAALVAGNTVIAKPAEQTPLVAQRVVDLFYAAGIPKNVLQLLLGKGENVGASLVKDPRINGVIFTGSTETAKAIQRSLVNSSIAIPTLIAETGGINALIADSTALPEQLVNDVIVSAFDSAGQRCSALRILCIQDEIADKFIRMLQGAMAEIIVGDPANFSTDVGPVIDQDAKNNLEKHALKMHEKAKLIYKVSVSDNAQFGTFFAPQAYEVADIKLINREVFGPILHVVRYRNEDLDNVIADINALGYGLTFGIHSRITSRIEYIQNRIHAGNIYVNRNIVGAVVGVQPFGGRGLSGTGPKAGGPHYLSQLCAESTVTTNTTAVGGNASLILIGD